MSKNKKMIVQFCIGVCILGIIGIAISLYYNENLKKTEGSQNVNEKQFKARIIEVYSNGNFIIEPNDNEEERKTADKISVTGDSNIQWKEGMQVVITYNGEIMLSYPARIIATDIKIDNDNNTAFNKITDDEAKAELEKNKNIIILDVRTKEEYDERHIVNSILIPVEELEVSVANILKDRQSKIFVYCRSGVRSVIACEILVKLGYEKVYDLGGIINWKYETE